MVCINTYNKESITCFYILLNMSLHDNNVDNNLNDTDLQHEYAKHEEYLSYLHDDSDDESDTFSVVEPKSAKRRTKRNLQKKKKKQKGDSGQHKIKQKEGNLVYFASAGITGLPIRDAIYGTFINEVRIGSPSEDLYFKVRFLGNKCDVDANHLYYENPEQFETHMNCSVSTTNKKLWADKYQIALARRNQEIEDYMNHNE